MARSYKWNFVFITESLDGGAVTYRSNRHFDILNDSIIFSFQNATTAQNYRDIFDGERSSYGQSLVLLNSTSQDEETYVDPFQGLIRYMVSSTIDGVPMVFYGQENGISQTFGFSHYEENFGKEIPYFKEFNSLTPILGNQTYALQQLYPGFAAVAQGRAFSPALRSSNRYYLNQTDGSEQSNIFSVAKYQTANASPGVSDVVFGFVNLDRNDVQTGNLTSISPRTVQTSSASRADEPTMCATSPRTRVWILPAAATSSSPAMSPAPISSPTVFMSP